MKTTKPPPIAEPVSSIERKTSEAKRDTCQRERERKREILRFGIPLSDKAFIRTTKPPPIAEPVSSIERKTN